MGIKRRVNAICALVISPRLYSTDLSISGLVSTSL